VRPREYVSSGGHGDEPRIARPQSHRTLPEPGKSGDDADPAFAHRNPRGCL
jgi:hypothetical protein